MSLSHGPLGPLSRRFIDVSCEDCACVLSKRKDSVKLWNGRCRPCSSKRTAKLPHVKKAMSLNGMAVMARVGKLPHYPHNYRSGPANNKWLGGITSKQMKIRNSAEMKAWRKSVFERDGYTCLGCGKVGGDLNADHIKPFALNPELHFDLSNGRTLCVSCHRKMGACVSAGKITRASVPHTNWKVG